VLCDKFADVITYYDPEEVSSGVVQHLYNMWSSGACVDEHMMDQLVVFMALAKGKSCVIGPPPSHFTTIHLQTGVHITTMMTGVTFKDHVDDEKGCRVLECEGMNFTVSSSRPSL